MKRILKQQSQNANYNAAQPRGIRLLQHMVDVVKVEMKESPRIISIAEWLMLYFNESNVFTGMC